MESLILTVLYTLPSLIASAPHFSFHMSETASATASPHQFPWLVSIQKPDPKKAGRWEHKCGGSLIAVREGRTDSDIFVTAAHCFKTCACGTNGGLSKNMCDSFYGSTPDHVSRIVVGEHSLNADDPGEHSLRLSSVKCHQDYQVLNGNINDIALVKLSSPVTFTDNIQPVQLPAAKPDYKDSRGCQIAGWGLTGAGKSPNQLRYANMTIHDQGTCSKWWKKDGYDLDTMLCAGHVGDVARGIVRQVGCSGDSGGSFTCPHERGGYALVGIASRAGDSSCETRSSQPDQYTKVAPYVEWIVKNSEEMTDPSSLMSTN